MTVPDGIDPRGPRFAAAITSALLLVATALAMADASTPAEASFGWFAYQPLADATFVPTVPWTDRATEPGFVLALVVALLFAWSLISPRTQPWALLFRAAVRPRLSPPADLEDPRPPRFAQGVGLVVVAVGLALHLLGVPWALPVATAAAFVAAFLNAVFGLCLGCQLYLLLQRAGVLGRRTGGSSAAA
ncbi:DUF4395 domain-containing protein [Microbacterium resistens]|uniref:DUF4395 domain-containing protein n=1 Tax=Microbacterium resistens TaxID=156977 RepID=UPI00082A7245|nr:DUF4395 domain-containing protein [Microbacterium resistens]